MLSKHKTWFLKGRWLAFFGLLVILDGVLMEQCDCDLTAAMRAVRAEEMEKRAEDLVLNVTNSYDSYLETNTKPVFDFYTKFDNHTKGNITKFVLRGYLYSLNWDDFTSGFSGLYNGYIYGNYANCSANYTCVAGWANLTTFMRNDYIRNVMNYVGKLVTAMNYPVGLYRPWAARSYNYSNFNYTVKPPQPCSCAPSSGYSHRVAFNFSGTSLSSTYYVTSSGTNNVMRTDLELQLDDIAANKFGPAYIQSRFDGFDPLANTSLHVWLYFTSLSSTGQISAEEINGNFSDIKAFTMRWLEATWIITSPPYVIDSCWYIKGQNETCFSVKTTSSTMETTSSTMEFTSTTTMSSTTASTQPSTVTSTIMPTESTSTLPLETTMTTTTSVTTATSTPTTTSVSSTSSSVEVMSSTITNTVVTFMAFATTQSIPNASTLSSTSPTTQESVLSSTNGSNDGNSSISASVLSTVTATPKAAAGFNSSTSTTGLGLSLTISQANTTPSHHMYSVAPFDPDPFFKAEVPVIPKVYNDKVLIKGHGGIVGHLTSQPLFYSIALPATLAMLSIAIVCMLVWQIDCLPNPSSNKP